jgi:hypothetical protein
MYYQSLTVPLGPKYFPSDHITQEVSCQPRYSAIKSATLMLGHGEANRAVKSTRNIHLCYEEEEEED